MSPRIVLKPKKKQRLKLTLPWEKLQVEFGPFNLCCHILHGAAIVCAAFSTNEYVNIKFLLLLTCKYVFIHDRCFGGLPIMTRFGGEQTFVIFCKKNIH